MRHEPATRSIYLAEWVLLEQSAGQQAGYGSFAIALDEIGTELCKNNQRQVCRLH